jgi:glutamate--cysteine ligase
MVIKLPADTTSAGLAGADTEAAGDADGPLSETDAERRIRAICFKTGPPGTIGAELEWLVRDSSDPSLTVPFGRISEVLDHLERPGALPGAGLLTLEPGGQVELSTAPAKDLSECVAAAGDDLAVSPVTALTRSGARAGFLSCLGMRPWRNISTGTVTGAGS